MTAIQEQRAQSRHVTKTETTRRTRGRRGGPSNQVPRNHRPRYQANRAVGVQNQDVASWPFAPRYRRNVARRTKLQGRKSNLTIYRSTMTTQTMSVVRPADYTNPSQKFRPGISTILPGQLYGGMVINSGLTYLVRSRRDPGDDNGSEGGMSRGL